MEPGARIMADLRRLGDISSRPLFGGYGICWNDVIFGILFRERLCFKVEEGSKGGYLAKGMRPFRPDERQTLKSYYEAPPEILDDREAILSWAREAIRVGQESLWSRESRP
jgi:DNA transformation protein